MWWQQQNDAQQYVRLPQISVTDGEGKSEQHQDDEEHIAEPRPMVPAVILLCLAISNALFMVLAGIFFVQMRALSSQLDNAQRLAFPPTDLESAKSSVVFQETTFSGALKYNESTHEVYRELDAGEPNYFGDPRTTPGIEEAWSDLLRGENFFTSFSRFVSDTALAGEFFVMTEEEAAPFVPELTKVPATGNFHGELDVFHSLHCLNAVRMHLDKDYYMEHGGIHQDSDQWPKGWSRAHLGTSFAN